MGLLGDWIKSKNMKDPARGTLQVTASTYPPDSATSGNFSINGIVSADGLAPTAIEHAGIARVKKWPHSGQTLPVTVDRADPTRIQIEWDEVPDSWDTARQNAEALAEAMRGKTVTASTTSTTTGADAIPPEALQMLRQMGIDPTGADVQVVSGGTTFSTFPPGFGEQEEDPAARLRKLQELKSAGLITDAEYDAQRARVLEDI
ncbi:MAG TPA: SHOCT domain-containing protein [Solirubrobacteraceae bacterium]